MTAKEYLKQAYRLDQQITVQVRELEELRDLSSRIQPGAFEERVSGTRDTDPPFVKTVHKIIDMQDRINSEVDRLVDLKAEMDLAIDRMEDVDERLVLRYRYINNESWDDIAKALNVSSRTVMRTHAAALRNFVVPG